MSILHRVHNTTVGIIALVLVVVASANSQSFPQRPAQQDRVLDEAALIHPTELQHINDISAKLVNDQQIPIVVVTVPSLAKYDASDIESYAKALFDNWGIGSQARNYGILLLVSLGDRKARIELGAAWAHEKDEQCDMIMNDIIVPNFQEG